MKKVVTGKSTRKVERGGAKRARIPDFLARESGKPAPRRRFRDFFTDPRNPEVEEPAPVAEAFLVATIGPEPPVAMEPPTVEPAADEAGTTEPADWPGPEHPAYQQALEAANRAVREALREATLRVAAAVRDGLLGAVPDPVGATRLAASVVVEARRLAVLDMLEGKPLVAPAEGEEKK